MLPRTLYLGLDPSRFGREVVHLPLIETVPRPLDGELLKAFERLSTFTHILLTSRTAVSLFLTHCQQLQIKSQALFICVGQATGELLGRPCLIAQEATSEGLLPLIASLKPSSHLFFPHSSLSRPVIGDFLRASNRSFQEAILYDTVPKRPPKLPSLVEFDEIVFTSPSTVAAFINCYGTFPKGKRLIAIGPVTGKTLEKMGASPILHNSESQTLGLLW